MALKEGEAAKEWAGREGYLSSRRVDVYYGGSKGETETERSFSIKKKILTKLIICVSK